MLITIDLKRQPQVADLIADMDMGSGVCFKTSLKSRNDSLAEFTLEKAEEYENDAKEEDDNEEADEGDEDASTNTPGGSVQQDKMAAAVSAQL